MLYGADVWDPRRIIAQIIGFQCYYYACLGVLVFLLVGMSMAPRVAWGGGWELGPRQATGQAPARGGARLAPIPPAHTCTHPPAPPPQGPTCPR